MEPQFGSFDSNVSLSCAGLPTLSSCAYSPATLTPGGSPVSATLTINTTASGADFPIAAIPVQPLPFAIILLSFIPALAGILFHQRTAMPVRVWALGFVLTGALLLAACGSAGKSLGTPTGSFNVTVNATAGSFQSSDTVNLVVQ